MKALGFFTLFFLLCTSCSPDRNDETAKNTLNDNDGKVRVIKDDEPTPKDGSVPRSKLVYKVMSNPSEYSLEQMDTMYREDIVTTASDYDVNLKNMWYIFINKKLVESGSEELKRFYLNEQIALKQNLPNLESFYKLLKSSSSFMHYTEVYAVAENFTKKNESYVNNNIDWEDENKKKYKLDETMREHVKFLRSMPFD